MASDQPATRRREFLDAALPHAETLTHVARGLTSNPHDAEDLVQETFLRAFAHFDQYRGPSMRAWLATICINAARSEARRRSRRPAENLAGDIEPDLPPSSEDVAERAAASFDRRTIKEALEGLPEPQRMCILMMDVAGYTASEVAAVLGCPRGTVLARVHRGRRKLADQLRDLAVNHGVL